MGKFPKGLPESDPTTKVEAGSAVERLRTCKDCGNELQIVSNNIGVRAWCRRCNNSWPISSSSLGATIPEIPPRGLQKVTLVEPDWNKAFEEISGDTMHEQVGPKNRR